MKITTVARSTSQSGQNVIRLSGGSYSTTHAVKSSGFSAVTKECDIYNHRDKDIRLIREMSFIKSLSGEAKAVFPAVLDSSRENNRILYTLEYIPYPRFSEVVQSGKYTAGELSDLLATIYDRLFGVLYKETYATKNALEELDYISLTLDRLKETSEQLPKEHFMNTFISADSVTVNGSTYPGVAKTLGRAKTYLQHKKLPVTTNHGDIIFQNILLDPSSKDFRLVDPNGDSIGYVYDISKTLLCLETKYDMFYQAEFTLQTFTNGRVPEASIRLADNDHANTLQPMNAKFWQYLTDNEDRFFRDINDWRRLILVICGLQNLAIVMFHALHHKEYQRACAFLLNGIRVINNALDR